MALKCWKDQRREKNENMPIQITNDKTQKVIKVECKIYGQLTKACEWFWHIDVLHVLQLLDKLKAFHELDFVHCSQQPNNGLIGRDKACKTATSNILRACKIISAFPEGKAHRGKFGPPIRRNNPICARVCSSAVHTEQAK